MNRTLGSTEFLLTLPGVGWLFSVAERTPNEDVAMCALVCATALMGFYAWCRTRVKCEHIPTNGSEA